MKDLIITRAIIIDSRDHNITSSMSIAYELISYDCRK